MGRVVFLVGASGAGKTSIARELELRETWAGQVSFFDEIGIPSTEEMERDFGGGEGWQQWATGKWMADLARRDSPLQLLEGQTRPSFIMQAIADYPSIDPLIVLLDCTPEVRRERLGRRGQPDLANSTMDFWAVYLRGQADALGLPVIDTSEVSVQSVADEIEALAGNSDWQGSTRTEGTGGTDD